VGNSIVELVGAIIVAIITGGLSLVGVIISNASNNKKMQSQLEKQQAITDVKIEALTEEVRKHNSFAEKIPVIEFQIETLKTSVSELKGVKK
jgi:hypothetical protein